jgi:hypothetical protein
MASDHQSLFADSYLRAEFGSELETFQGSEEEQALLVRLRHWASRELQNETSAQNAFIDRFFKQVWGYVAAGERDAEQGYTCYPQFAVGRAGATGGTGQADLALGLFGTPSLPPIPQALCEFKDIRSGLDTPQRRKNDTRSPVRQCADYLRESAAGLFGNEPVQPHWGIVTDMNEFRLYRRISMPTQYQRFVISPKVGDDITSLLGEAREASFQRLLFSRLFHVDRLISAGGDPPLINDLKKQFIHERALEQSFYKEYRAYRERLIEALRFHNPHFTGMRPLISGGEAGRYESLETDTWLLFPYELLERGPALITEEKFSREYPLAWRYLRANEASLRARENDTMDVEGLWWGFVYPKNLDKHCLPKLAVSQTVRNLEITADLDGTFSFNNVRVNGILADDRDHLLYVLAVLNAPVANWVFHRIAKPKSGGFFEANKQFVAPLPVPIASVEQKQWVASRALELTALYSQLRNLKRDVEHRLEVCDSERRSEDWLLPTVGSIEDWKRRAPEMSARLRTQWAKENRSRHLLEEMATLQRRLSSASQLRPHLANGELSIESNGVVVIDHVFVSADEGEFLLAQWKVSLWKLAVGAAPTASKVVDLLRNVKISGNTVLKAQVVEITEQASTVRNRIDTVEQELNDRIAELYRLTPDERALIATV